MSTMQQPTKFLVIQLRQIGDVLISTTVCETLKKNFPTAQVDYMVYPYAEAIVKNNPAIDNIIVVPNGMGKGALRKMWGALKFIRRQKYDYAIDIVNTPKSGWITALSGAKVTIGRGSKKIRQCFYDIKVADDKNFLATVSASYSVKNRLLLLTPISKNLQWIVRYQVYLSAQELTNARDLMLQAGINSSRPIFFFMPGCRAPDRDPGRNQWPVDYFVTIMNHCIEKYQAQIITYPGPGQLVQVEALRKEIKQPQNFFIFKNGNLRESAAMIAQSDLYIGNDTAPHHVAMGFDTPSVATFAPRINYRDWQPGDAPRHLALAAQEALNLTDAEYLKNISRCDRDVAYEQHCYRKMTPDLLMPKIDTLFDATYKKVHS
ncbi:MAG: glycosyltransferase family 9 protein [Gammaproteobacteria bacterium]|nr:glycosyltransferase family 9 protein [Gammaproteobacteria bacterium]